MRSCNQKLYSRSRTKAELTEELELLNNKIIQLEELLVNEKKIPVVQRYSDTEQDILQRIAESAAVFDTVTDPFIIYKKTVIKANPAALKRLKFDPVGLTMSDILSKLRASFKDSNCRKSLENCISNGERIFEAKYEIEFDGDHNTRLIVLSSVPVIVADKITGVTITWRDVTVPIRIEEALRESEERYRIMGETVPYGTWLSDKEGGVQYFSPSFLDLIQMDILEAKEFGWTKKMIPEDVGPMLNRWFQCVKAGEEWEHEYRIIGKLGNIKTVLSRGRPVKDRNGNYICWVGINLDITERKEMEDELKKIEWLLTKKCIPSGLILNNEVSFRDLSYLNENGEILNSCGKSLLTDVVSDCLDLLGTCASVNEENAKYALSIYRSEWCRYLDNASRELCNKKSPEDAFKSNEWLCRKYCWEKSSKIAIETGTSVDTECCGGIRIFAVPIRAGGDIVGAVNFGYSDPPKEPDKIAVIASRYHVSPEKLLELANRYESRPNFIIDTAKNRLLSSSRMIGSIVERKRAEIALQTAYAEIEKQIESRTAALSRSYNLLKEETRERMRAEMESSQRNHALESVYAMATAFSVSLFAVIDQVVLSISSILNTHIVAMATVEKNEFKRITQVIKGELLHFPIMQIEEHPCGIAFREGRYCQISGDLDRLYPLFMKDYHTMKAYIGVPVLSSKGKLLGTICALDSKQRGFSEYEVHLIEIFARYIGHEIERKLMERQLLQSQEMKMLGQLTSGVAHEVRNPLNGILAITEALSNDLGGNPDYITYIEHIRKQVSRLSNLMRDLLDLGRPIENSNLLPTSIMWLISTAVNMWQNSCSYQEHSIRIIADESSETVTICADRSKMEQVIVNLLENACAHSVSEKEIVVAVKSGERMVTVQVIDQGTGIKPEHFDHLFEPFFTTRRGGTGLGLGIVKRIVESHGGGIEIRNNSSSAGVTAEIQLPIADVLAVNDLSD